MRDTRRDSSAEYVELLEIPPEQKTREITFFAPGFKKYKTTEYVDQDANEFVSISVTGMKCALNCEHCRTNSLKGMIDLPNCGKSLFDLCAGLKSRGAKGILLSGGSDRNGRVPLKKYLRDLSRIKNELGLRVSVHPGLPDEEMCHGLAEANVDSVMLDIIGDERTIKEIYHLDKTPEDYRQALATLSRFGVPIIPHVMLGHYYGQMRGEYAALEMIGEFEVKMLVVIIAMPLNGTGFTPDKVPGINEIDNFFRHARRAMPDAQIILGCARPMGKLKDEIDRAAIDAGFDGVAFPVDGLVKYAVSKNLITKFENSCCSVR